MNSTEILKTISGVFDTLSKKFGVAASQIYPILIKQTKVDLVQDILVILVSFIVIFFSVKLIKWGIKKDSPDSSDPIMALCWIIGGVIILFAGITIITDTSRIIQILINPEYYIFSHYIQPLISNNK